MARVGKVEDGRAVGVADLDGRDSIVAGASRRVFQCDRLADAVGEAREPAGNDVAV